MPLSCTEIPDDTLIWRYMDITSFLFMIQRSQLALRRVDAFSDHFEGHMPRAMELQVKHREPRHKQLETQRILHYMRQHTHAVCWNVSQQECYAMWKIYGGEDISVCVSTTVERLKRAIERVQDPLKLVEMRYIDMTSDNVQSEIELFNINFKDISFRYENEVRLMASEVSPQSLQMYAQQPESDLEDFETPVFRPVDVDLDELIQDIYVTPSGGDHMREIIHNLCLTYHGHINLQDRLKPSRFLWEPEF